MKIILLGPPGAGKGTQAKRLSSRWGIPHVATGDIMRAVIRSDSALSETVRAYVDAGQLVPDDLVVKLLWDRLEEPDCTHGFILDGFPRTFSQAQALQSTGVVVDAVVQLVVDDAVIIERVSGRLVHMASGRIYHCLHHPPKVPGYDDISGEPLVQRADDEENTVRARLTIYHEQNQLVLDYYRQLARTECRMKVLSVSGQLDTDQVEHSIVSKMAEIKQSS